MGCSFSSEFQQHTGVVFENPDTEEARMKLNKKGFVRFVRSLRSSSLGNAYSSESH